MKIYTKLKLVRKNLQSGIFIPLNPEEISDELEVIIKKNKIVKVNIEELYKNRTLEQNSKYWALINEIGRVVGTTDKYIHEKMIKDYGVIKQIKLDPKGEKYYEYIGKGIYKIYKESHLMNTKEFERLLNGAIYEAKELGIQV